MQVLKSTLKVVSMGAVADFFGYKGQTIKKFFLPIIFILWKYAFMLTFVQFDKGQG